MSQTTQSRRPDEPDDDAPPLPRQQVPRVPDDDVPELPDEQLPEVAKRDIPEPPEPACPPAEPQPDEADHARPPAR